MVKRAPTWHEMMRMNLELKLIEVSRSARVRSIPFLFLSETNQPRWLERLEPASIHKSRSRKGH